MTPKAPRYAASFRPTQGCALNSFGQQSYPQGRTSVTWRAGLDEVGAPRICAVFSRTDCGACAARELCKPAKAARRSVSFLPRPEYEALNAARARMHDPVWKEPYQVRASMEGTLSQGVRAFDMRRSRYVGGGQDRAAAGLYGGREERRAPCSGWPERRAPKHA